MEKGAADMSDKRLARRVILKLKFENVDVPEDIALHLVSASYTDNEDGSTEDFSNSDGIGQFTITIKQKKDKLDKIEIEGGYIGA